MTGVSENQLRALSIVEKGSINGHNFAKRMWPDSNMHLQSWKRVNRAGLHYLFKLEKCGWVRNNGYMFTLTDSGKLLLKIMKNEGTDQL